MLRAIDKLDRLGVEGVRALLGAGRKDESGDFTKGAGLSENQIERLVAFLQPLRFRKTILVLKDVTPNSRTNATRSVPSALR